MDSIRCHWIPIGFRLDSCCILFDSSWILLDSIGFYLVLCGKGPVKAMRQICSSGGGWGGLGSNSVHDQGCWYELCRQSVREDGAGELLIHGPTCMVNDLLFRSSR